MSHISPTDIVTYGAYVVAAASAAAAVLPQGTPGSWWNMVRSGIIDVAGMNIWNAKNAPKP